MAACSYKNNNSEDSVWYPEVISLGPGGEKGYIELGVLHTLYINGFLTKVHTYIGCSVGAAISLLMVCGYEPSTIINRTMKIEVFKDLHSIDISKLKTNGGLLKNNTLRDYLTQQILLKFGYIPTFEQLYKQTNINLTVVSNNLNQGCGVYFSHISHPDMSVIDAVALSANIPGIFERVQYDGDTYIDGAFADPHPVNYYDNGKTRILGLYITTKHTEPEEPDSEFDVLNYFARILYSSMTIHRREKQKTLSKACRQLRLFVRERENLTIDNKITLVVSGISSGNGFIQRLITEAL